MLRAVLLAGAAAFLVGCDDLERVALTRAGAATTLVATTDPLTPASADTRASRDSDQACPSGMQLVEGSYCRVPRQRCLRWLETRGRFRHTRCAEYERPARCVLDSRKKLRFCIDRDEWVAPGQTKPQVGKTMLQADSICRAEGKRLCKESEWTFACEGERMQPYPYGFSRDATACNADRKPLVGTDGTMVSLAEPPGSFSRCESPFGVRDMTGNVEEWTRRDDHPNRGAMKGSYWIPTKNHCRAAQRIHGPLYSGIELGFRCCADAP
jgi:formylglycine-generating enzyme